MGEQEKNVSIPFRQDIQEFSTFDRKVRVAPSCQGKEPSLYSLVRAWVHSGHSTKREPDPDNSSQSVSLPPSQPLVKEELKYPPQCFAIYYTKDSDVEQKLANVYKSAWVTAHTHYCNHKAKQRRRHKARQMVLLATAQQTQRCLSAKKHPATPPQPQRSVTFKTPITPPALHPSTAVQPAGMRPSPVSMPLHAQPPQKVQKQGSLEHGHYHVPSNVGLPHANTPQPLEAIRTAPQQIHNPTPAPASPGSIPMAFSVPSFSGTDAHRQAHNLADRRVLAPTSSQGLLRENIKPECHMVAAPVNLADMQLRTVRQLNMSSGMDAVPNSQPPAARVTMEQPVDPFCMHPANCEAQKTSSDGNGAHGVSTVARSASAGVSVTWEGFHSDNADLQRQLQQLSEKESPIMPPARLLSQPRENSMGRAWEKSMGYSQGGGLGEQSYPVNVKVEPSSAIAGASSARCTDMLRSESSDMGKEESEMLHRALSAPDTSVPVQHSSVYRVSG